MYCPVLQYTFFNPNLVTIFQDNLFDNNHRVNTTLLLYTLYTLLYTGLTRTFLKNVIYRATVKDENQNIETKLLKNVTMVTHTVLTTEEKIQQHYHLTYGS